MEPENEDIKNRLVEIMLMQEENQNESLKVSETYLKKYTSLLRFLFNFSM